MTTFEYLSVLLSVVVGLALAHLLAGVGSQISQPERHRFYWIHGIWTVFVFQYLILFWWFEFQLSRINVWRFEHFVLIIVYASLLYGLAVLLYPRITNFDGDYRAYYFRRRAWFMWLLVAINGIDVLDTLAKGLAHWQSLGWNYLANVVVVVALAIACARSAAPWLHAVTAVTALAWQCQITWSYYGTLN